MIDEKLLAQEAKNLGINITDEQIMKIVNNIITENKLTNKQFREELAKQNQTFEDFFIKTKENILKSQLLQRNIQNNIVISDKEIQEEFTRRQGISPFEKSYELSLILLNDSDDLNKIAKNIKNERTSFADAAKKFSIGPNSENGGSIGLVNIQMLAPEWKNALKDVAVGEITKVFPINNNYALIRVDSEQNLLSESLKNVQDLIAQELQTQKQQELFLDFIKDLKNNAIIDIRL